AKEAVQFDMRESRPSTRVLARQWIEKNVPEDSSVVREMKTAPLNDTDLRWRSRFSLPYGGWTLARYRLDGFQYFVTNGSISGALARLHRAVHVAAPDRRRLGTRPVEAAHRRP